jgi:hypothetical protein
MTINTSSFAKALEPGVNAWYGKAYNEWDVKWTALFDQFKSKRNYEEDVGTSSFGLAVEKPEGSPISFDSERQGFTHRYRHVVYALGFSISREMLDDDQYDVAASRRAQGLAFSMRQTKETVGANIYNRAFNTSYTYADGVTMLNSAHPNVAGGTQSNVLSTASDLSEAALEQAVIDISLLKNDRGLQINLRPQTLILPPQYQFEAQRILKSVGRVATANNDVNALKDMGLFKDISVNPYLTDTDAWFIRTNAPHGMKYFERDADEFGSENDWDSENAKFKARARYSFGMTDWRGVFGTAGA